jgi:uncharacterized sporulation protein YeaH/YhbH (DUF444 family)
MQRPIRKSEGKRRLGRFRSRWKENIKENVRNCVGGSGLVLSGSGKGPGINMEGSNEPSVGLHDENISFN